MTQSITAPVRVRAAERQQKAVEMRKAGAALAQIAAELDVSVSAVHKMIKKALLVSLAQAQLAAAELRELEAQRLDARELHINTAVAKAMRDEDFSLVARLDGQLAAISAARRKLFGLDEPERHDITSAGKLIQFVVTTDETNGSD